MITVHFRVYRMAEDASSKVEKASASVVTETTAKAPSRIRAVFFGFLAGVTSATVGGYFVMEDEIKVLCCALGVVLFATYGYRF